MIGGTGAQYRGDRCPSLGGWVPIIGGAHAAAAGSKAEVGRSLGPL